jgi:hypothetical protein
VASVVLDIPLTNIYVLELEQAAEAATTVKLHDL